MKIKIAVLAFVALLLTSAGAFAQSKVQAYQIPYPLGATPVVAAATGTTSAVSASLAASTTATTWICGFAISATGGTAAFGPITISNLVGSVTFTFQESSQAGGITLTQNFQPCIPGSAKNTAITVATTGDGTASAVDVNVWGFQW